MNNQYQFIWERLAGPDPNLRAADADRERAADRLRKGHTEGRLDLNEFQERLERCYEAKTLGQLRELVQDLPRDDAQVAPRASGGVRRWSWYRAPLVVPILILFLVISTAGHEHHVFWIWIPLLFLFWRLSWWRRRSWAGPRRRTDDWL